MVTNDGMHKKTEYTYIQGAADDHESWAEGLTPKIFWENSDLLLSSKQDIYENLREILEEEKLNAVENINTKDDDEVTEKDELLKNVYFIGDSGMAIGASVEGKLKIPQFKKTEIQMLDPDYKNAHDLDLIVKLRDFRDFRDCMGRIWCSIELLNAQLWKIINRWKLKEIFAPACWSKLNVYRWKHY